MSRVARIEIGNSRPGQGLGSRERPGLVDILGSSHIHARLSRLLAASDSGILPLGSYNIPGKQTVPELLRKVVSRAEREGKLNAKMKTPPLEVLAEDIRELQRLIERDQERLEIALGEDRSEITIALCYVLPSLKGMVFDLQHIERTAKSP